MSADLACKFRVRIARKDLDVASYAHQIKNGCLILQTAVTDIQNWLGREDSNLRMPDPKTGALPLGYAPMRISETYRKRPRIAELVLDTHFLAIL